MGATDIMEEAIAQRHLTIEPPEVLLTPRLGSTGRSSITAPPWQSPKDARPWRRCCPLFALHLLPRSASLPLDAARLSRPSIGPSLLAFKYCLSA